MNKQKQVLALVRHAHSFANAEIEQPAQGHYYAISGSDKTVGVTEKGLKECTGAGKILAHLFPESNPIESIRTTDYLRTEITADDLALHLSYSPNRIIDSRLNKREYGIFWNMTYLGVEVLHPEQFRLYRDLGALKYRPPGGENYYDLFERTAEFVADTLNQTSGNQVIVGHSASILALMKELEGLSPQEVVRQYHCVSIPNAYIMLYERDDASSPWIRASVFETLQSR